MATPQNGAMQWKRKARYGYELLLMVLRWYALSRAYGRHAGPRTLSKFSPAERAEYEQLQKNFKALSERGLVAKIGAAMELVPWMRIPKDRRAMVRAAVMEAGKLYRSTTKKRDQDKRLLESFEYAAQILYRPKVRKSPTALLAELGVAMGSARTLES